MGRGDSRPIEFDSHGVTVRGRLYLPDRLPAPVVVMAHGYSATIPMLLDSYAEVFQKSDVAALAFDHPGLGTSDGDPRFEINPWISVRAYLSALDYVTSLSEVDAGRIALWGDSLSSRVALVAAAMDDRVSALVCQVPAMGETVPTPAPDDAFERMRSFITDGEVRRPAESWQVLAVVSTDQDSNPSALLPITAFRWFIEYGGRYSSAWQNRVVLTSAVDGPAFDPFVCAGAVLVPTLFVMSPDDEMPGANSDVAREMLERLAGPTECVEVDGGHFGIAEYPSALFDDASAAEARFLRRVFAVD